MNEEKIRGRMVAKSRPEKAKEHFPYRLLRAIEDAMGKGWPATPVWRVVMAEIREEYGKCRTCYKTMGDGSWVDKYYEDEEAKDAEPENSRD